MSAVAESFKGYQYYEFTVIKDLAEPSRLLAEMNSGIDKTKEEDKKQTKTREKDTKIDDALIDISESQIQEQKTIRKGMKIRIYT